MATTSFQPGGYPGKPYGSFAGRTGGPIAYTLSCATGVYAYAGGTATLAVKRNYTLACATGVYVYAGPAADLQVGGNLIGRKYPRRGRSRPRKVEEIPTEDLPEVSLKVKAEKAKIADDLAAAQADLVSVELMAHNKAVNRTKQISELKGVIQNLEQNLEIKREEEALIMLASMLLEM